MKIPLQWQIVIVAVPPSIEGSGEMSYPETVVNSSITMHCPAFAVPPPVISWFIDGVSLKGKALQ